MFKNRKRVTALLVLAIACLLSAAMSGPAEADEGGTKDSTGLVWGPSSRELYDYWTTWNNAAELAQEYWIVDSDRDGIPTLYEDWRLTARFRRRVLPDRRPQVRLAVHLAAVPSCLVH